MGSGSGSSSWGRCLGEDGLGPSLGKDGGGVWAKMEGVWAEIEGGLGEDPESVWAKIVWPCQGPALRLEATARRLASQGSSRGRG